MDTHDMQDQDERLEPILLLRPERPQPDDVDRFMRLTDDERADYDAWRYVRSIQRYWRERERELRPPTLLLLARLTLALRRRWRRFVEEVRRQ